MKGLDHLWVIGEPMQLFHCIWRAYLSELNQRVERGQALQQALLLASAFSLLPPELAVVPERLTHPTLNVKNT